MRVSPISTNVRTFIKTNIAKQTAKKSAVLLSASGLAAILPAKDFIKQTQANWNSPDTGKLIIQWIAVIIIINAG